jgi:hypothetical protein
MSVVMSIALLFCSPSPKSVLTPTCKPVCRPALSPTSRPVFSPTCTSVCGGLPLGLSVIGLSVVLPVGLSVFLSLGQSVLPIGLHAVCLVSLNVVM